MVRSVKEVKLFLLKSEIWISDRLADFYCCIFRVLIRVSVCVFFCVCMSKVHVCVCVLLLVNSTHFLRQFWS